MTTRHYEHDEWADYARGLVMEADHREMSDHLAECAECEETVLIFGRLATMHEPPEAPERVVRRALGVFRHPHPGAAEREPARLRPRILFDSALAAAAGGTRRAGRESRRQLFEAGDYFLDLDSAVQPGTQGPAQVVLIGQLLSREDPARPLPEFLVRLEGRDGPMAQTESNALGEFELLGDARRASRIAIPLGGVEIELDLPKLQQSWEPES